MRGFFVLMVVSLLFLSGCLPIWQKAESTPNAVEQRGANTRNSCTGRCRGAIQSRRDVLRRQRCPARLQPSRRVVSQGRRTGPCSGAN